MVHSTKRQLQLEAAIADTVRLFNAGMTCGDIAERLGVHRGAIRQRLIKAGLWEPDKVSAARGLRGALRKAGRPRLPPTPKPENDVMPDRTPCPWCEVRADIGCRHSGRRLAGC
jgi:hypothetical protein